MFDFLSRTFSSLFSTFKGKGRLAESDIDQFLEKIRDALLEADVPYQITHTFCQEIKQEASGQQLIGSLKPAEQLIKIVHDRLVHFLGGQQTIPFNVQIPSVILVMGLQGSGKTTTIAKMAYLINKEAQQKGKSRRILVASVDFYRPAAIDQLHIGAKAAGVAFYRAQSPDPLKAAQEIYAFYQREQYELLFLDTAGRLHIDSHMVQELHDINVQLKPRHTLLVLDAMTGQESLAVAQSFDQQVGFEGAILTKIDSDTRGGAAFAFRYALKKPIYFIGTGEKVTDFERCYPERMAGRILGRGDIQSLIERVNEQVKESEQERLAQSLQSGRVTLQDFADQLAMMNKLGSMGTILKFIPGMAGALSPEALHKGEIELRRFKAIIGSMTRKERLNPAILDGSRKKRIAQGAGVAVSDVNSLLARFEQTKQYAKLIKKFGRFPGF